MVGGLVRRCGGAVATSVTKGGANRGGTGLLIVGRGEKVHPNPNPSRNPSPNPNPSPSPSPSPSPYPNPNPHLRRGRTASPTARAFAQRAAASTTRRAASTKAWRRRASRPSPCCTRTSWSPSYARARRVRSSRRPPPCPPARGAARARYERPRGRRCTLRTCVRSASPRLPRGHTARASPAARARSSPTPSPRLTASLLARRGLGLALGLGLGLRVRVGTNPDPSPSPSPHPNPNQVRRWWRRAAWTSSLRGRCCRLRASLTAHQMILISRPRS